MNEKMRELMGLEENPVDKEINASDVIEKEVEFDFNQHIEDNSQTATIIKKDEKKILKRQKQ